MYLYCVVLTVSQHKIYLYAMQKVQIQREVVFWSINALPASNMTAVKLR